MERRHPSVVNISEVAPRTVEKGTRFSVTAKSLGRETGAQQLGCTHYIVPPGKTAFPYHFHTANDEAIYVLAGEGTLRLGDARVSVRAGDWINLATGPAGAHQLLNTGSAPLEYLCMSTTRNAEVVGYPDSKKLGMMSAPTYAHAMKGEHWVRMIVREGSSVDYYDGEDTGE